MKLMLDTNICIYIIKQKPPEVLARFREHSVGDIVISSITVAEFQCGVERSEKPERNQRAIDQFLLPLIVSNFDHAAAVVYGECRAALEREGRPIGPMDMLIAAHAVSLDLTLITNNTREFARVPGLTLDNWVSR